MARVGKGPCFARTRASPYVRLLFDGGRAYAEPLYIPERGDNSPMESVRNIVESKKALVERLFASHRGALQAFFYRRIRDRADARDLAQEVYARLLRVGEMHAIRDLEAYLYTVASNLAKEHAARGRRRGITVAVEDASVQEELAELAAFDSQIDVAQQVKRLREVLRQLPAKWHAAIVLHYVHGLSHQETAQRLSVSPRMVKRYLGQALGQCRRRMAREGSMR